MNTIATATEKTTVVRIGKGLTFHAQLKGVDVAAAMCGTVGSLRSRATATTGTVSCRKCLDQIAATEALEAEAAPVEAREQANAVSDEVHQLATPAVATVPAKGDLLSHKSGAEYTMVSLSKDGLCYRVTNEEGKASYIRIGQFI